MCCVAALNKLRLALMVMMTMITMTMELMTNTEIKDGSLVLFVSGIWLRWHVNKSIHLLCFKPPLAPARHHHRRRRHKLLVIVS